ncbi:MAG: SdiA-regulated domain-containing protein [Lewinella sp.]|nr:SdiA-regulated domain-containing protein [Lewinella sp.]
MKIDLQDSSTLTWLILGAIVVVALTYSTIALRSEPPVRSYTLVEGYQFPYDLYNPEWKVDLPSELKEISGIAALPDEQVLAIQDEAGILFSIDLRQGNVHEEHLFGKDRDYEDLCLVGDTVFVLERDGDLYRLPPGEFSTDSVYKYETSFSYRNDTESLCYDPVTGYLLMSPKESAPDGSEEVEHVRGIYGFSIDSARVMPQPLYSMAEQEVGQAISGNGKPYNFKPSAIGVHPQTGHIYVLASVGKLLLVLDRDNRLLHIELMDASVFPQAEGISFDEKGRLLIASEGVDRPAFVARFATQPDVK